LISLSARRIENWIFEAELSVSVSHDASQIFKQPFLFCARKVVISEEVSEAQKRKASR